MTEGKVFIYGLVDPRNGEIRYIGKTDNPPERLRGHQKDKKITKKRSWIVSLRRKGLKPVLVILQKVSKEKWREAERFQISFFRQRGFDLTNSTDGGDGVDNPTLETRQKMRDAKRGISLSEEHREKIRMASQGRILSEEHKKRIGAANAIAKIGSHYSNEHIGKVREAVLAKWADPEYKKRVTNRIKEVSSTPEARLLRSKLAKKQWAEDRGWKKRGK